MATYDDDGRKKKISYLIDEFMYIFIHVGRVCSI